jgi:hypothetical protein
VAHDDRSPTNARRIRSRDGIAKLASSPPGALVFGNAPLRSVQRCGTRTAADRDPSMNGEERAVRAHDKHPQSGRATLGGVGEAILDLAGR